MGISLNDTSKNVIVPSLKPYGNHLAETRYFTGATSQRAHLTGSIKITGEIARDGDAAYLTFSGKLAGSEVIEVNMISQLGKVEGENVSELSIEKKRNVRNVAKQEERERRQ